MQDKDMVNDVLSMVNGSLSGYASAISQTENEQLRQTLQQIRNNDENCQYNLYKVASQKGFYKPASQATSQQIQEIKSQFNA
ncbi:spore coat protein [Clostridium sp. MSJ-4]|uniref:Spore coat protein n=1 Tax=Clostridium simiarum TaxID=2841506 RepID=A0ABS6F4W7_9CLOT|nr:spore coat protein [Clostridium simiarum]MBU5592884.1 spore coat protein [Clostridium simiarum]